jgi:hypothetical protein
VGVTCIAIALDAVSASAVTMSTLRMAATIATTRKGRGSSAPRCWTAIATVVQQFGDDEQEPQHREQAMGEQHRCVPGLRRHHQIGCRVPQTAKG